jgi:hypothetical protein
MLAHENLQPSSLSTYTVQYVLWRSFGAKFGWGGDCLPLPNQTFSESHTCRETVNRSEGPTNHVFPCFSPMILWYCDDIVDRSFYFENYGFFLVFSELSYVSGYTVIALPVNIVACFCSFSLLSFFYYCHNFSLFHNFTVERVVCIVEFDHLCDSCFLF